jgi:hypothetical protein
MKKQGSKGSPQRRREIRSCLVLLCASTVDLARLLTRSRARAALWLETNIGRVNDAAGAKQHQAQDAGGRGGTWFWCASSARRRRTGSCCCLWPRLDVPRQRTWLVFGQRDRSALHRITTDWHYPAGTRLLQRNRRSDARARQRRTRHCHAACRYGEGGAAYRGGVSLSAPGNAKLGWSAGDL